MQPINNNSVFYAAGPVPDPNKTSAKDLQLYLVNEFSAIQAAIGLLAAGHLDKSYAAPTKPRDGDFRYADGTSWNPGSGAGFYRYNGSAWVFLG